MSNESTNLTRRKFMIAGSAAIASPLLLSAAGSMVGTKTAEAKIAKGTKIYFIGDGCIGCQACWAFCPVKAIRPDRSRVFTMEGREFRYGWLSYLRCQWCCGGMVMDDEVLLRFLIHLNICPYQLILLNF